MRERLFQFFPPLVTIFLILVLWHILVESTSLPSHLLPSPMAVFGRLWDGLLITGDIWPHLGTTFVATFLGFLLGSVSAILVALAFSEWPLLQQTFYYPVIGFQATPKVALAPLLLVWLGFGLESKVVLVGLVCFFPIFTATAIALNSVNPSLRNLMRAAGATRWHRIWHLELPAIAGPILTGLQIAFGFALIGCVVMEFILGTGGAGFLIENSASTLDAATAIAAMILLGVMGSLGVLFFRSLRSRTIFWDPGESAHEAMVTKGGAAA